MAEWIEAELRKLDFPGSKLGVCENMVFPHISLSLSILYSNNVVIVITTQYFARTVLMLSMISFRNSYMDVK